MRCIVLPCQKLLTRALPVQAAATAFRGVTKRFDHDDPIASKPSAAEERTKADTKSDT